MVNLNATPDQLINALRAESANGQLTPEHIKALEELISGTRPDVEGALPEEKVEGAKPADMLEIIHRLDLEAQYGERLNTLKHYGFLAESGEAREGDIQPPTFEKAMSAFTPQELEIASYFQKPTLLLIPETSFAAKIHALDAHKQGMQKNDTYIDEIYTDSDSGSDKITGWRAVIADGARVMGCYEDDKLDLRLDKRIEQRRATRKPGEKGMDRHRYVLLMMEATKSGNPVDKELFTLLDDDSALSGSDMPYAGFDDPDDRGVCFGGSYPDDVDVNARFRSSVGGDVLLI